MAETHKGFGLLFEMGCGKTLTAIMIAGTAYQMGKVEKVLVVAPTSVCSVWPKDFAEFAAFKANIKVLLGDKNRRLKLLNDLDNFPFKALKVAVINYVRQKSIEFFHYTKYSTKRSDLFRFYLYFCHA